MIEKYLTVLRNVHTPTAQFRNASDLLAQILCGDILSKLDTRPISITTPVGKTTGSAMPTDVMVVPILRAGLALLSPFQEVIPGVPVGILGLARHVRNPNKVRTYYRKFPRKCPRRAIILDPMLATGNSAVLAVKYLMKEMGYHPANIYFAGVIGSVEGVKRLQSVLPKSHIVVLAVDRELNAHKYIVPGLGDYGDRYFGT